MVALSPSSEVALSLSTRVNLTIAVIVFRKESQVVDAAAMVEMLLMEAYLASLLVTLLHKPENSGCQDPHFPHPHNHSG